MHTGGSKHARAARGREKGGAGSHDLHVGHFRPGRWYDAGEAVVVQAPAQRREEAILSEHHDQGGGGEGAGRAEGDVVGMGFMAEGLGCRAWGMYEL